MKEIREKIEGLKKELAYAQKMRNYYAPGSGPFNGWNKKMDSIEIKINRLRLREEM